MSNEERPSCRVFIGGADQPRRNAMEKARSGGFVRGASHRFIEQEATGREARGGSRTRSEVEWPVRFREGNKDSLRAEMAPAVACSKLSANG
jgi:hypothetical protein